MDYRPLSPRPTRVHMLVRPNQVNDQVTNYLDGIGDIIVNENTSRITTECKK